MKVTTSVEINDKPPMTFHSTIAEMTGDDGTHGSISILTAPTSTQTEGSPVMLGLRGSQHILFEHEGRRGMLDLATVFERWVEELGDTPPNEDEDQGEIEDLPTRRAKAKEAWEAEGEPKIGPHNSGRYEDLLQKEE